MTKSPRFRCLILCLFLLVPLILLPLSGCGERETVQQNAVRSVSYEPKSDKLCVEIGLTDAYLKQNDSRLYLFEMPAGTVNPSSLTGSEPIADAVVRSNHVTIRVAASDGPRSRLFSSFVPASLDKTTGKYVPIAAPCTLTSATAGAGDMPARSIKGVAVGDDTAGDADAVRLGASSVVIPVRMDLLMLSAWEPGAVSYLWDGETRWLQYSGVGMLDARVDYFTRLGIRVYLRLMLGRTGETGCPDVLYCPGSLTETVQDGQYGVNMTDSAAAKLMEGFLVWLVQRYAADGSAVGRGLCRDLIIGDSVNVLGHWHSGKMPSDQKADSYERLLRMADTALSLYAPAGGVFADVALVSDGEGTSHVDFLKQLSAAAEARGDFNWNLSGRIDAATSRVWTETDTQVKALLSRPADMLDTGRQNAERNNERRFILTVSAPVGADDEVGQAASYAYIYTAAAVEGRAEALLWDTSAEPLRRADGSPREIWDMAAAVDTQSAGDRLSVARSVIGKDYTLLGTDSTPLSAPVVRADAEAAAEVTHYADPSDVVTFADGSFHGFTNGGSMLYAGLESRGGVTRLCARLTPAGAGAPAGISATLEPGALEHARELILPLSLRSVSGTDVPASLTVLLSRPASPGRDALLYSFVLPELPSGDVTVSCHIDEFTDRLEKDDTVVLTILVEPAGRTSDPLDLTLEAVRAIGVRHSSAAAVILIICGVVFLTAAGLAVWFLIRTGRIRLPKLSEIFKKPVRFDYR